jgi:hypothetical protein
VNGWLRLLFPITLLWFLLTVPPVNAASLCGISKDGLPYSAGPPDIEIAFSPSHGTTDLVVRTITQARQSARLAAYELMSEPIAQALLAITSGVSMWKWSWTKAR